MLDAEGAFAGLSWADAKPIAAAICFDVCSRDDSADFIRNRARNALAGGDGMEWQNREGAARALNIAAAVLRAMRDPIHPLRKRAHRRGLSVVKRGDTFRILEGPQVVFTGSESDVDQYLQTRPARGGNVGRIHPLYTLPPRWQRAVDGWAEWLRIGGQSPNTVRLRYDHVRMIARRSNTQRPQDIALGDLVRLSSGQTWSREHRKGIRRSLVSFFDWCISNTIADTNPATGLPRPATDATTWRDLADQLTPEQIRRFDHQEAMAMRSLERKPAPRGWVPQSAEEIAHGFLSEARWEAQQNLSDAMIGIPAPAGAEEVVHWEDDGDGNWTRDVHGQCRNVKGFDAAVTSTACKPATARSNGRCTSTSRTGTNSRPNRCASSPRTWFRRPTSWTGSRMEPISADPRLTYSARPSLPWGGPFGLTW
jgi:hypothetical protein